MTFPADIKGCMKDCILSLFWPRRDIVLEQWELHDVDTGIDLAHHVRSYCAPDFSAWSERKDIGEEVSRLLKALRKD